MHALFRFIAVAHHTNCFVIYDRMCPAYQKLISAGLTRMAFTQKIGLSNEVCRAVRGRTSHDEQRGGNVMDVEADPDAFLRRSRRESVEFSRLISDFFSVLEACGKACKTLGSSGATLGSRGPGVSLVAPLA